jgi:hypothetical protein
VNYEFHGGSMIHQRFLSPPDVRKDCITATEI